VNAKIRRQLNAGKQRIERRLDKAKLGDVSQPVMSAANVHFEIAERTHGINYGGLGAMVLLVRRLELAEAIDRRLHLLKLHLPYHESDHVLNLAYNALCDGRLECSPKSNPCVMRVSRALRGKETLDEGQEAQCGADHQEAA
jgi:hypothetical protein